MGGVGWHRGDRLLDLYDVLDVVHSGGMGLVYRVRHLTWQVDLAVKTPRPALVATPAGRARFEAEAGTWVGLGLHPHVVECAYVRRVGDVPCVFAEWVDGGSLATAVRQRGLYLDDPAESTARILDVAIQAAWGIGHAHERGVIHQDVKPANVMLDAAGTAKITDFGLAKARAAAGEERPAGGDVLASYGGMTPAYCSPEQAAAAAGKGVRLTRATDVWSWALCVLEMFVGRPPCRYGQTAPVVLAEFLASGPTAGHLPPMPAGVADLLRQCFADDPFARPAGMDDVAAALAATYTTVVGTSHPRVRPEAASLLADSLSNQALSLVDLGQEPDAEARWREAINVSPHDVNAVYNWGLYRWRKGRMTDVEFVSELERARDLRGGDPGTDHLLGFVELERGHDEAAGRLLRGAPDAHDLHAARAVLSERAAVRPPRHLSGARGGATCLTLNADGSVAAFGTEQGHVLAWRLQDHEPLPELPGADRVHALVISADGSRGLVAYVGGAVVLWDVATGTRLRGLSEHGGDVTAVALDRTGRTGATAHRTGAVIVWDLDTGTHRRAFTGDQPATAVALDDHGTRVVAVTGEYGDHRVHTWDVSTGRPGPRIVRTRDGYLTGVDGVTLSADGGRALLYRRQESLQVWDSRTGRTLTAAPNLIPPYSHLTVSRDGEVVVSVGDGSAPLRVWDTASGRCLRSIDIGLDELSIGFDGMALSADARVAVVLEHYFSRVQVHHLPHRGYRAPWNYARPTGAAELGRRERRFRDRLDRAATLLADGRPADAAAVLREAGEVPGFDRHPERRALWAEAGRHGTRTRPLAVWSRWTRTGIWIFTQQFSLGLSSDGEVAVTGGSDGLTRVWQVATGECRRVFGDRAPGHVHTIMMSEGDRLALTADYGGGACLWDLVEGRMRVLLGDQSPARSLATNGRLVAIGHLSGAVCVWELHHEWHRRTILAHEHPVGSVAVSGDGVLIATRSNDEQRIRVWDAATGRRRFELASNGWRTALRFGGERGLLFANEGDGLHAYDMSTGRLAYALPEGGVEDSVTLSADGRTGATVGFSVTLIWDTASGDVRQRIPVRAKAVALTADGRYAALADGLAVQIWDLRTGRREHLLDGHVAPIVDLRFTADDHRLLSADITPLLRLWELDWDYEFGARG